MSDITIGNKFKPVWKHNNVVGQAFVRIFFATIVCIYSYLGWTKGWFGNPPAELFYTASVFLGIASLFLLLAGFTPSNFWYFKSFGMSLDLSFATYYMIIGDLSTVYLYGIYLWIVIGNGLRFGINYLYLSNILSIIGFSVVIFYGSFWQQYPYIGGGLMIWLVLMPIYISKLLRKLETAVETAHQANKAKSEFLATMSHEIRTPLGAIIGYAESSLEPDQSMEERLEGTQRIIYNSTHLLSLINDILDLSKIEAGKLELENTEISTIELVNDVYNLIRIKAEEKQLKCKINYTFPLPSHFIGDSTKIKQILINLMSNAIKFTEEGHVYLKVSYSRFEKKIFFEIEDSGIGITEEQQEKIFNAFVQADTSTSRKYGGTGLGLSLSKYLVEKMGGIITINSIPGEGSHFTVVLGIKNISNINLVYELEKTKANQLEVKNTKNKNQLLTGKVLLVEDNRDNQQILSRYMKRFGVEVTIANNGAIALDLFPSNEFDMIFIDMQMPVMDGPTATKKIRETGCDIPIIALTANAYKEDEERCIAAGCNSFVTKPISRDHLYETLSKHLDVAEKQQADISPIISNVLEEEPDFIDVVQSFTTKLPDYILKIKKIISEKNWDELKPVMHGFKGTSGSMGFPQLAENAAQIEFQLLNNDYIKVQELSDKLKLLADRVILGIKI